ncbi:AraC family transcriptional regulator [Ramlibacter sp. WS9]|nr:AraC family transcriptional regulator [Ramlibacter sp. WS9]
MFASQGIDTPSLLQGSGIDAARLDDPRGRFSPDEVSLLWELAVRQSGDPVLGVDRALAALHINFDVVGYATLSSADLRSALHELARYLALISSATSFELQPQGVDCWIVMGHMGCTRPVPPQRSAYSLLALLTLCQWVTRRELRPLAARFSFAPPGDARVFERAFGCPVLFTQPDNQLLLAGADLAMALPSRNPALLALHEQAMDERMATLGNATMALRVSEEIIRRLHRGEPRRQDVAAALALADRTLQRRLRAEGTSFQQLLDKARRELAQKYLSDSRHALGEVAHLLGFADQSNFFRACRRWFGTAPGRYREQGTQGQ